MAGGWYEELRQRRVFRALVGYGVVSFAVLQVVEPVMHGLGLPEWFLGATVVALGLGFPVTLVLAWAFDVNAGRIEAAEPRPRAAPLLVLAGLGLLLGAPGVGWWFWKGRAAPEPARTQPQAHAASTGEAAADGPPSIAVLAFADLSPAKDQEYFSDGIAEEILDALARVKGLKVAGRTSSFHFKGKNEDLRTIGQALGVANVLEGSVRKQGNKVRITAQLVQASDGFHRWSRTFDGELTDVFELQERIARAITSELKVVLQGAQRTRLVPVATASPEAYALYLQASAIFNRRAGDRFPDAVRQLEQALALDQGYARAHARLAALHALGPAYAPNDFTKELAAAEAHARRALALDPALAEPHAALGLIFTSRRQRAEAKAELEQALALDPDDASANLWLATELTTAGYGTAAKRHLDHLLALDPMLPNAVFWRGAASLADGDLEAAAQAFRRADDLGLSHAGMGLSTLAEVRGDRAEAARQAARSIRIAAADAGPGFPELFGRAIGGDPAARAEVLRQVEAYLASRPPVVAGYAPYILLRLGEPARAMEVAGSGPTGNDAMMFHTLWGPLGRPARTSKAFGAFARRCGLAALWDRDGAPDLCQRGPSGEYTCR